MLSISKSVSVAARRSLTRGYGNCTAPTIDGSLPLFLNNELVKSTATDFVDIVNPATMEPLSMVPLSTQSEMNAAVASCSEAFPAWRDTSVSNRVRVMLEFQHLIKKNSDLLAKSITEEQGKTTPDAHGDVFRGVEVVEHSCSMGSLQMGGHISSVSKNMDSYEVRQPLGVCAGIAPFNFPVMCPLWMMPMAIATGNTFILKPSEKDAGPAVMLAQMAAEAGLPPGVLNVIHGTVDSVNFICDAPEIKAIGFVGSNQAGEHIYKRAGATGKRVQANMGAKNHTSVMPDAHKNHAISAIVGASMGAAGQRCMALSVAILVGESQAWVPDIVAAAKDLKVGSGFDPKTDVGPMITPQAVQRAERLIQSAIDQGAKVLLDGRGCKPEGFEKGNFLGPTVVSGVTAEMDIYKEEVFGPVICLMEADTLDHSIEMINANEYGNGASIFTSSGYAGRRFQHECEAGQLGINVPIPVALPFFSFSGNKKSFWGSLHMYGKMGVQFFTRAQTVTTAWQPDDVGSGTKMTSMATPGFNPNK